MARSRSPRRSRRKGPVAPMVTTALQKIQAIILDLGTWAMTIQVVGPAPLNVLLMTVLSLALMLIIMITIITVLFDQQVQETGIKAGGTASPAPTALSSMTLLCLLLNCPRTRYQGGGPASPAPTLCAL